MQEAMEAEFDTVASWTADIAAELGESYFVPAACRGSGSPAALDWLIDRLAPTAAEKMLDCGAGVGGPAAFAAERVGVTPLLTDLEFGGCRAAGRLFGLPVVQAGLALPFRSASFDVVWCLGVLCTVADQARLLTELRRVTRASGRLGLLVFVRTVDDLSEQPDGNHFPAADGLDDLLARTGWAVVDRVATGELDDPPADWSQRAAGVEQELARRHGSDPAWQTAAAQSAIIGRLLDDGQLVGTLIVAGPA